MNFSFKCLGILLCSGILASATANANTDSKVEQPSVTHYAEATNTKAIPFKVYKDGTSDVSVMNQYMSHPAKLISKNHKWYVQFKLQHADWWQSFELYEGTKKLDIKVIEDNKKERIVEVEVTPGLKTLNAKVHIVIPDLSYNNRYTTQIQLDQAIPNLPSTTKQQPEEKPDHPDKMPENTKDEYINDLVFKVLKHQTQQTSVMDQYLIHPAKVTYKKQQAVVQLTLKNASWWQSFELFNGSQPVSIQTIKENKAKDQRIVQFTMPSTQEMLTAKVHVVVPHLNYDHWYTTEFMFGNAVQKTVSERSETECSLDDEVHIMSDSTESNQQQATSQSQEQEHRESMGSKELSNIQSKVASEHTNKSGIPYKVSPQPLALPTSKVAVAHSGNDTDVPPLPEIMPKFNRYADKHEPLKLEQTHADVGHYLQNLNKIYLGVIILLAVLLLLGSILYIRKDENRPYEKKH